MKLNDFRLETFDERSLLNYALASIERDCPDWYRTALHALQLRISRTQCSPGGCEYCDEE